MQDVRSNVPHPLHKMRGDETELQMCPDNQTRLCDSAANSHAQRAQRNHHHTHQAQPQTHLHGSPRRNELWDVQRLLILAAKKESPATCPMARVPADALAVLGSMISDFLRVPSDMHLHPPATMACKRCFTPVCKTCEENGVNCSCGVNDLRSRP